MAGVAQLLLKDPADAGFCSADEDVDPDGLHSPTDASEDSIEVKVTPIPLPSSALRKRPAHHHLAPPKKRLRASSPALLPAADDPPTPASASAPFRPWKDRPQEEPLSLVTTSSPPPPPSTSASAAASTTSTSSSSKECSARNYKNMTRERRIEANARERTRVHTISAAFETLRRAVPAYSHNQKLSKLSVLRIACSYILTLAQLAGMDYSADGSRPGLDECVDMVTRTIQVEGKLRKKRDD